MRIRTSRNKNCRGMRWIAILFVLFSSVLASRAQDEPEYRMEIGVAAGAMTYQGDFCGSLVKNVQPAAGIVWRYLFNPRMGLRVQGTYGKLKGNSDSSETWYPDYSGDDVTQRAHYDFTSTVVDVSVVYEYNFLPYGTGRDYFRAKRFTPYVFIGLGGTYAQPKPGDSNMSLSFPFGVGIKYKLGSRTNLGVAWGMHFTTGDKLDGVKDPYGITSSGLFKNTDSFSTLMVSLTYSFKAKCRTCNNDHF